MVFAPLLFNDRQLALGFYYLPPLIIMIVSNRGVGGRKDLKEWLARGGGGRVIDRSRGTCSGGGGGRRIALSINSLILYPLQHRDAPINKYGSMLPFVPEQLGIVVSPVQ